MNYWGGGGGGDVPGGMNHTDDRWVVEIICLYINVEQIDSNVEQIDS